MEAILPHRQMDRNTITCGMIAGSISNLTNENQHMAFMPYGGGFQIITRMGVSSP